jgi:putative DNA primase/helicase
MNMWEKYIEKGWAVFPCQDKIPLTAHGYKDAVKTMPECQALFAAYPDANIAIATGAISKIFVLDIDIKKENGNESLKQLEDKYGPLPETPEVLTCSGGRHLYFNYVKGIGCKTGVFPGIDIRGDGGYVIAPQSIINGKTYEWEITRDIDTGFSDPPAWLVNLINNKPQLVPDKIDNNRNDKLMRIGSQLSRNGLDLIAIEHTLQSINSRVCVPPLDEAEVAKIAKSVSRYKKNYSFNPLTDVWNADFFIKQNGNLIRFCDTLGGWFVWDGTRWKYDNNYNILSLAKQTVKQIFQLGKEDGDDKYIKHAIKSESEAKLRSMINLSKSENITLKSENFDTDVFLLNLKNGIFDLQNNRLIPHNPDFYITKRIEYNYVPDSPCPEWLKFLDFIFEGDKETIDFMQRALGYSLSGSTSEHCLFILHGIGMNGKSTFLKHIFRIMGDYAINTPSATLMEKYSDGIPNDIARLKGSRFVIALESGKSRTLAEAQIKQLTGDDPISARFLHKEFFDFFATFKIFFATNHKPAITGTDRGIWRRIITIPFDKVISEEERDVMLDDKLKNEYEGILRWMIEGFKKWQEYGLARNDKVQKATAEYRAESDIVGNFINEQCILGPEYKVSTRIFMHCLQEWIKENGYKSIKRNDLMEYMKKTNISKTRLKEFKNNTFWIGVTTATATESSQPKQEDWTQDYQEERPY